MVGLKGIPVSPGFAQGTVFLYLGPMLQQDIPRYSIEKSEVKKEYQRFHLALAQSSDELESIRNRVIAEIGEAESQIFNAHLTLLQDPEFIRKVMEGVERQLINVEQVVDGEIQDLISVLSKMENDYLRERTQDVRDVGRRILKYLGSGSEAGLKKLPAKTVLVAHELLPSETLNMDRKNVVAIVTEQGGETSHSAILARSMGIPAVTGVEGITRAVQAGTIALVDGESGSITLSPSENLSHTFQRVRNKYEKRKHNALTEEGQRSVTQDGAPIRLFANITRPEEAEDILLHCLEGVGLFRTEFLVLGSSGIPDKNSQVDAYRRAMKALHGRPLTIRAFDLGGDKLLPSQPRSREHGSYLGLRGLRYLLSEETLLRAQLAAILEAEQGSDQGSIRILFPMVIGGDDFRQAADQARRAGEQFGKAAMPPLGAMIETPAAVFSIEEILEEADFLSIGTNDLTQYILAADRGAAELSNECSVLHPAVLRAIRQVIRAAAAAGKPVTICGEGAGDPLIAALLIGLGGHQLSMSPNRAAGVRQMIRQVRLPDIEAMAEEAVKSRNAEAVRALVDRHLRSIGCLQDAGAGSHPR